MSDWEIQKEFYCQVCLDTQGIVFVTGASDAEESTDIVQT